MVFILKTQLVFDYNYFVTIYDFDVLEKNQLNQAALPSFVVYAIL